MCETGSRWVKGITYNLIKTETFGELGNPFLITKTRLT